ncbi:DUF2642 domain-containing protein [Sporosarcina sp. E16_3]|uniref:DUF2642 domain-containing protein n=1 Tax=Sporosarcina sp. E16_3 TaxID=2789293 RepID=UPI001A935F40|nr:DUF2642 domain-containing protein [Sporosarcina sp. E16_3]MBO0602472.1 DUF2642 domain-containing protein [Sporosarcina sp. E16_3]
MNNIIQSLVKQVAQIEVSGKKFINGTVIDLGSDMIVLFNGKDFVYIPLNHIQNFKVDCDNINEIEDPKELPSIPTEENEGNLSFGAVLTQAKGKYVEIYVAGGRPLHGYITAIMSNYFVFESPVYKTMYISLNHLKWLIPYAQNEGPYGLDNHDVSLQPNRDSLANTFDIQVGKLKNKIVVFNTGGNKSYIGKVNEIEEQIVEIQTARANFIYLNLDHIKTVHQV